MYEVELKVRAEARQVRASLEELNATPLGSVRQEDVYYDAPDRDFAATDEALRVRTETTTTGIEAEETGSETGVDETETVLTYKGPLVDSESKTRTEAETAVTNPAAIRDILDGLGYEPAATVAKDRERYRLDGCTVTVDDVDGLGEFVEVELETEDDIESARERATAVLERLDLDPEDGIRTSYLGLLLAKGEDDTSL